jgi:hypothetical protein
MSSQWTFMVYMAGNNSLSDAADDDLAEMRKIGSSDDVNVLAFVAQRRMNGSAKRLKIEKDGQGEECETLSNVDSGDPQTVVNFIRWAIKKAPAKKYALILWNHGGGWEPDDFTELYSQVRLARGERVVRADARREMTHRASQRIGRTFFRTSVEKILSDPSEQTRAILADDDTGHSLDTIELGNVLKLAKNEIGHSVDLLGMDACLMCTLEVAYQVMGDAGVLVGSEQTEPGAGWDYATLLGDLTANPTMDARELGKQAVTRYISSYKSEQSQWPVTQCALDSSQIAGLCDTVDALEQGLRPTIKPDLAEVVKAQRASVVLNTTFRLVDLNSLCKNLGNSDLATTVRNAAKAVQVALKPGGVVIAEAHLGREVADCGGVSVYMPGPAETVSPYYKDLDLSRDHRWGQFLQEYIT